MKPYRIPKVAVLAFLVLVAVVFAASPARACTVFVLTDSNHTLFCNNEDWSLVNARIWFRPAGEGYHGAAYVGFDSGIAQGGVNTEGLAYDWVLVYRTPQPLDADLPRTRGWATLRMLETCATVKEAIAFYRTYAEPAFATSAILVTDKTGASAIIGIREGRLQVEESRHSRGFGFGRRFLQTALDRRAALAEPPEPTVAEGFKILYDCRQVGEYSTKYSNIFDLKSGDIFLRTFLARDQEMKLNLAAELKKAAHYYDMPRIKEQLAQAPKPLLLYMKRFPLDEAKPIPDKEPKVTAHVRAMILNLAQDTQRAEDFTAKFWEQEVLPGRRHYHEEVKRLGKLLAMTLVEREETNGLRSYRYRVDFTNATALVRIVFDAQNRASVFMGEEYQWKSGAKPGEPPKQGH